MQHFDTRVSKPLMHRPIVQTLLKAGASGEEADALAAEVFEACHEETEHMMLKQRKNISVIGTLEEHVGSDLMLDMGVLSKAVFAKYLLDEILPGICLNDTCNESGRDENNENIQLPNNNDTISDDYMNPLLPNRQENSPVSPSSSPVTASCRSSLSAIGID